MSIRLKGGHTTQDQRLDRLPSFDGRSRAFPVAAVVPELIVSKTWRQPLWLDQGREGACVSFAWHHEAAASPVPVRGLTYKDALRRYKRMQQVDEWPGEDYSGTSVLAGAKIMQGDGYLTEYRWCFNGVLDVCRALSHEGPVVLGIPWKNAMFDARPSGLLDTSGDTAGGHAILAVGLALKPRLRGETKVGPVIRLHNSWGKDWGKNGDAYIKVDDLDRLLREDGEACVPMGRLRPPNVTWNPPS